MEKLLDKYTKFQWNEQFQESVYVLKDKMVSDPMLVFPYQKKKIHVHANALYFSLDVILAQPGEGSLDQLIAFASRKMSKEERNYTTTKREAISMVYALHKF